MRDVERGRDLPDHGHRQEDDRGEESPAGPERAQARPTRGGQEGCHSGAEGQDSGGELPPGADLRAAVGRLSASAHDRRADRRRAAQCRGAGALAQPHHRLGGKDGGQADGSNCSDSVASSHIEGTFLRITTLH